MTKIILVTLFKIKKVVKIIKHDRQGNAMGLFKKKSFPSEVAVAESSGISPQQRDSLAKGVSGKGTPGIYDPLRSSGYIVLQHFLHQNNRKKERRSHNHN